ncbi:MvaI/BcnI family restriction endonuclease [Photobacterium minamisatsumaniensis]|uniref:MvaI/BcnI family restriction endonuclease n=1 Tax=Photobacterium minamisatsumaniensis TaxID=2910233 RepID=UPI003D0F9648
MSTNKTDLSKQLPTRSRVTQRAKKLKKELNITHKEALKSISAEYGFANWHDFQQAIEKKNLADTPTPQLSLGFVSDDDVEMSNDDYDDLDKEREDDFSIEQKEIVAGNKKHLAKIGAEFSIFEPTITGLKKSILDATQPVRTHFELEDFHDYAKQEQGPNNKVKKDGYFLTDDESVKTTASLYRPKTKKGDPRMWFRKLPSFCEPGDQVAIIIQDDRPYLINLSKTRLDLSLTKEKSAIKDFLAMFAQKHNSVAAELLAKLKELAKAPLPALREGDTGIGFTLETMLGIEANSSKEPDYKGIELKAGRGIKTRTTLFAQVADWKNSPCKKSAEILNKYGYEREDDFKLYCTISTQRENSQGLSFIYDQAKDQLEEWHNKTDLVAIWPGKLLRDRLKEKHAETFWVEAKSEIIDGKEHFHLLKVMHTKSPIISQLLPLIQSGVITMDHLIKKSGKTGRVSEKGPLFKMNKRDLGQLFPEPITYALV